MIKVEVQATPRFARLAKKSMTQEAIQDLIDALVLNPEKGKLITGTGEFAGLLAKATESATVLGYFTIMTESISFYWWLYLKKQIKKTLIHTKKKNYGN